MHDARISYVVHYMVSSAGGIFDLKAAHFFPATRCNSVVKLSCPLLQIPLEAHGRFFIDYQLLYPNGRTDGS